MSDLVKVHDSNCQFPRRTQKKKRCEDPHIIVNCQIIRRQSKNKLSVWNSGKRKEKKGKLKNFSSYCLVRREKEKKIKIFSVLNSKFSLIFSFSFIFLSFLFLSLFPTFQTEPKRCK
ncbi:hypothetical protein RHGRI_009968 [Rhododendron griersonianum]|uniref:Transmembrane protein n=1 Tax=Rhododendron griersonianum TaxID=479676 RepID=A0AAV6KHG7_9ERIC|nr:hypothetical protein RHGRI_009968 [Rhododendron griersonianum]